MVCSPRESDAVARNRFYFPSHRRVVSRQSSDPTVIQSLAVSATDLVSALEANRTTGKQAVLRVTPPFSGRMRARLHIERDAEYEDQPQPLHIQPRQFVEQTLPQYPRPADTEDDLRADPDLEYTVDRHHERHRNAVSEWRNTIPNAIRDTVTIETTDGTIEPSITVLGEFP